MTGPWRPILLEALILLLLGSLIGLSFHHRQLLEVWSGRGVRSAAPAVSVPGTILPEPVALAELRTLLEHGALPVDARSEEQYAEGHLPGAISLPLAALQDEPQAARRLPVGPVLVTYCNGYGCNDSFDLAVLLIQAGFTEVRVFEGGFPVWQEAGLPVVGGAP